MPLGRGGMYRDICAKCGAVRIDNQFGLEKTPDEYVANMVAVFREVWRVLKPEGTLWLNLGDSYNSNASNQQYRNGMHGSEAGMGRHNKQVDTLKPKDLVGIPWRVAFALQADGWYLRSEIIWCLSGGAWIYAKTQKGVNVMMVRDLFRLDPSTVQLWSGEKWTQLLGMNKSKRSGGELEIVLRSGERISCTLTHKFPTNRGLLQASDLVAGDTLIRTKLPDNEDPKDCAIDIDAAWFAGLYIAEGSRSDDCIQIAGHRKEEARWLRVERLAKKFGGSATRTINGNSMSIRVHGKILNAIIDELVTGKTAKDKGFSPIVWKYSDKFIKEMLDGYLSGDGHLDGNRWRIGFTRNYNLERDLRVACARLGYHLVLNLSTVKYNGSDSPTFIGEIRMKRSGHHNEKNTAEIVEIRKSRCREVYDLGVEDDPHVFALASGILTHNSKPNPMPESVTDRPTKSHETIFLLAKQSVYYYDHYAILEKSKKEWEIDKAVRDQRIKASGGVLSGGNGHGTGAHNTRNRRSVWTVSTKPYTGAHFATYPPALIEPCILAGCPDKVCPVCGKAWERVVEREAASPGQLPGYTKATGVRNDGDRAGHWTDMKTITLGFRPTCDHENEPVPGIVLDPFFGSGTTGEVAIRNRRRFVGLDLSLDYIQLAKKRVGNVQPVLFLDTTEERKDKGCESQLSLLD